MRTTLAVLSFAMLLLVACSGRSPDEPPDGGNGNVPHDAAYWTGLGWDYYEAGSYQDASNAFHNATTKDSLYVEAIAGYAWANLELGYIGLALGKFERSLAIDSSEVDSYYGAAYMEHSQGLLFPSTARLRFELGVVFCLKGLERGGEAYVFAHNGAVNAVSLRVLLARLYYGLGLYDQAEGIVDLLDPNNGLSGSSPSYLQDLLLAIESLEELIP